jgi:CheY-like chemotaxis protein
MHTNLTGYGNLISLCLPDPPDWNHGCGWTLHRAHSAREAMQAFRRERQIELLLSAMHLPDMPLWPLISRIRALRPRQPWVLVEMRLSDDDEVRARSLGALKVLEKMPHQAELLPLVTALRQARLRSDSS